MSHLIAALDLRVWQLAQARQTYMKALHAPDDAADEMDRQAIIDAMDLLRISVADARQDASAMNERRKLEATLRQAEDAAAEHHRTRLSAQARMNAANERSQTVVMVMGDTTARDAAIEAQDASARQFEAGQAIDASQRKLKELRIAFPRVFGIESFPLYEAAT